MGTPVMSAKENPTSVIGGVMIVAGTMIGAGMLTLPIISAGMWTFWTLLVLLATFFLMLASAYMILWTNVEFDPGASFNTLVKSRLGPAWNIVNGLSVGFVLYMLLYAYTSGGGATIMHSLNLPLPQGIVSLLFGLALAICIFWSTRLVDRASSVLVVLMIVLFFASIFGILPKFNHENMRLVLAESETEGFWFIMATLPYFLTSFCFHASVPSLVKYYGTDVRRVRQCIFWGMVIALAFYAIWIFTSFGVLGRGTLRDVYGQGGNVNHFLAAMGTVVSSGWINHALSVFAFLAVVTSFLGAGLGLFDYIADALGFDDSLQGRIKTALIAFCPPVLAGVVFPDGFIIAIGFAGFAAAIWSVIVPAAMEWKRTQGAGGQRAAPRHWWLVGLVLVYGLVAAVFHLLSPDVMDILPVYR